MVLLAERSHFAITRCLDPRSRNTKFFQIPFRRLGPFFPQDQVIGQRASFITMPFDEEGFGLATQPLGIGFKHASGVTANRVLVEIEINVTRAWLVEG